MESMTLAREIKDRVHLFMPNITIHKKGDTLRFEGCSHEDALKIVTEVCNKPWYEMLLNKYGASIQIVPTERFVKMIIK